MGDEPGIEGPVTDGTDEREYRLFVVEFDDEVFERRNPSKPNLYVGRTVEDPDTRAARLVGGKGGPKWLRGHVRKSRMDLVPPELASAPKSKLNESLRAQGHTVNHPTSTWRVYVIDLDDAVLPESKRKDGLKGWVYVGETSKPIEERVDQHRTGARKGPKKLFNNQAHRHFVGWNETLTPTKVFYSAAAAKAAEARLAEELRADGYRVEGGH